MSVVGSENPIGADDQQERLSSEEELFWFLAGLVEGEGSVHIAVKRHASKRFGCYIQPEFFIYQHRLRRPLLEMAQKYFEAGRIRPKPGNPDVLVFSIIARRDVSAKVVPFLERCMRLSARVGDYSRFVSAVRLLEDGEHRTRKGLARIVELAYEMNMGGKQRRIPIGEILDGILRGHTPDTSEPR